MTNEPQIRSSPILTGLALIGWAVAFFGAFAAFYFTPSRDFGLAAGWNKVSTFIGWQAVAMVLAVACVLFSRGVRRGAALRWMGLIPVAVMTLLAAALAAFVFWASSSRPPPDPGPPPKAATEAAPPVASPVAPSQ